MLLQTFFFRLKLFLLFCEFLFIGDSPRMVPSREDSCYVAWESGVLLISLLVRFYQGELHL